MPAKAARPRSRARPLAARAPPRGADDTLIVGVGASAGGLDACRKLVEAVPADGNLAFVLVQHLDPTHESMMVDLLAGHTPLAVRQAEDGMPVERGHLYVIPPGSYLAVRDGLLHLSAPRARHGARLPFDFLLHSLAEAYGARAAGVILSGTGTDGSLGLTAVKEAGGLVVAQDPDEAGYDGMPRSAIRTGTVDLVLPAARIPQALATYGRRLALARRPDGAERPDAAAEWLPPIIDLLRAKTAHDFRLYKPGTLQRRIERRMAMAAVEHDGMDGYVELLRRDPAELELLAKDLLINVTRFFRDPKVFDLLEGKIVPDLVRDHSDDHSLRIWIPGCSTGEETYSLAMLFLEGIASAKRSIKLQVFGSDVDADAVAIAREGLYPDTIAADVSPPQLARFFTREEHGYRVSPELRASVVFTVQDVLADPPFSRLDLVSCRNLLIYLRPDAQAKVITLLHFALRENGILLLGNAETVGPADGRFTAISKSERLYRRIGHGQPAKLSPSQTVGEGVRAPARLGQPPLGARQMALAELCRRLVMERYAPAAVLINRKFECLYSLGPTDRYLRVAPGQPTLDMLAMARPGVRTPLRSAIQRACQENARVIVAGGRMKRDGATSPFDIAVEPVMSDGEELLLVCFVDTPVRERRAGRTAAADLPRVAALERELEATRRELEGAHRDLEMSGEDQRAINEEALSVNEEFQATNEELLASKEELQSLNEELTALNGQLQETLERQRTTANDLQNVLYSTDVATIFLDTSLHIRFFTPATKLLFNVIPSDIGRPLADLSSLAADGALLADAGTVLATSVPSEREIEALNGAWYVRRILPYRTQEKGVEGVVITFADITERRRTAEALAEAKQKAETANAAKSHFLAAASHDLRQPLQALTLIQERLAQLVEGERPRMLVARLDETLGAMSGMLNALLDINQIEAGTVHAAPISFPVNDMLERLRREFTYQAEAHRLVLRVVPCDVVVRSDPRLLEQMVRNLLSNALKYTSQGKVLLGCRHLGDKLSIEIWDTGVGIPKDELHAIFEEYHQLENPARERSRGLGLGLSIVHRLGALLGHRVHVRSRPGHGSVFAIEVDVPSDGTLLGPAGRDGADTPVGEDTPQAGTILVVEDDPEVRRLLGLLLKEEGYHAATAADGPSALALVAEQTLVPDLILADYNLPNGMNGLQLTARLRTELHRQIPVIVLTGDISTETLREIASQNCLQLNKPIKLKELAQAIRRLLPPSQHASPAARPLAGATSPVVFIVDDDSGVRAALRGVIEEGGHLVEEYADCESFLEAYRPGREACLLVDAYLPGMNGLELLRRLQEAGDRLPAVMITGNSDVSTAVEAMKAGASDFIEKPVSGEELLASIGRALEQARDATRRPAWHADAASRLVDLTPRERQIMDLVVAGQPSKNIAADLGISRRTVENHRASIMHKTGAKSLPALARLALAAAWNGGDGPLTQDRPKEAAGIADAPST